VAESGAKSHRMAAEFQRGCRMVTEKPQSGQRRAQGSLERLQNIYGKIIERYRRIQSDYRDATERLKSDTTLIANR
jgi:hypothetical protein